MNFEELNLKQETFPEREERILQFWKEKQIFKKSLKQREIQNAPFFSFYDGPPFATGLPHYGHLLAGAIKDVIPRYKTMRGYYVPRRFGWDCHGLPIENEVEKSCHLSGAASIEEFGVARFNEECRKIVLRYTEEWQAKVERFGRWVDFSQTWKTMDLSFMESVWWVFGELYKKGLIYEGFKVMPFSAKLGTPLSNFEASENYKEVDDPSIVVAFPLLDQTHTALLIWTTTPWTLISNMAASVHPEISYVRVASGGRRYILAQETLSRWFSDEKSYQIEAHFLGKDLVGTRYRPLFPHFAGYETQGAFRVISADFVTTSEGTGIVHTAPAFGEEDFYACKRAEIPLVCPVNNNGHFTKEVAEYQGLFVKDADKEIIQKLKAAGHLFFRGTLRHRYPFCWRSDTPLIYKAVTTWFFAVEKIKEDLIQANQKIHWTPTHLKEGRFGNWLEGAREWAISRNRYWGTPIPVWRSQTGKIYVISSLDELEKLTQTHISDMHRHFIDELTFEREGELYRRIPEVFDCWFDAGSMPYAQNHYPFENKLLTEATFPADFIAEGVDQTRGWFYTLLVLSVALFNQPAYKNVIANGILLAEDGNKMSKRLKNYPEPDFVIHKYGADAVRLYMLSSPAVKADDLRFSERGVELVLRQQLIPLWNALLFFLTYAEIEKWHPDSVTAPPPSVLILDRWMIALLYKLIHEVETGMDSYDLSRAVGPFVGFIEQLTNWYIRRSRRRFWSDQDTPEKRGAFATLYFVLITLAKVAAPFVPFISEAMYQALRTGEMPESIHLCDYPAYREEKRDILLEQGMDSLQIVVSLGHALRKEHKLKVRQPLPAAHIICREETLLHFLQSEQQLIADELNVKQIFFHREGREFVHLSIKPNFRILGKKVGRAMKEVQLAIESLSQEQITALIGGVPVPLLIHGTSFSLTQEDVEITQKVHTGWIAMNAGILTIALDTQLSEPLILEGMARELVNKINLMRKNAQFEVTDRIQLFLGASEKLKKAVQQFSDYIHEEVLATQIHYQFHPESQHVDINGEPAALFLLVEDQSQ